MHSYRVKTVGTGNPIEVCINVAIGWQLHCSSIPLFYMKPVCSCTFKWELNELAVTIQFEHRLVPTQGFDLT
ncbi:unnamed protein product [Amaranthus hypochondriacus]